MHLSEKSMEEMPLPVFKKLVKLHLRKSAFISLEELKDGHNKVKENKYEHFNSPQEYNTTMLAVLPQMFSGLGAACTDI